MRTFVIILFLLGVIQSIWPHSCQVPIDYANVQTALDSCSSCDTIWVAPGRHYGQMVIPDRTISLFSRFAQTGDSNDIANTILDGQNVGMTIQVCTRAPHLFTLQGFTVSGGRASRNGTSVPYYFRGGAVDLEIDTRTRILDCSFTENNQDADMNGAVMYSEATNAHPTVQLLELSRVRVENNLNLPDCNLSVHLMSIRADSLIMRDITFRRNASSCPLLIAESDIYSFYDNITADSVMNVEPTLNYSNGTMIAIVGGGKVIVRDFAIRNCSQAWNIMLLIRGHQSASIESVNVLNNRIHDEDDSFGVVYLVADTLTVDSLTIAYNTSNRRKILRLSSNQKVGEARDIVFTDNFSGDSLYADGTTGRGLQMDAGNISFYNCRFERNTSCISSPYWDEPVDQEGIISVYNSRFNDYVNMTDTLYFEDCLFKDNLLVDNDPYENYYDLGILVSPNKGRALSLINNEGLHFAMRRCAFINNRQTRHVPEALWDPWWGYSRCVGSTFELHGWGNNMGNYARGVIEDCLFQGNSDGGAWLGNTGYLSISNCRFIDNERYALNTSGYSARLSNVLIVGTHLMDCYLPDYRASDQHPLSISTSSEIEGTNAVNNITIADCSAFHLLDLSPQVTNTAIPYVNVVLFNNEYEALTPGWGNAPTFSYSCLEEFQPGEGNILADPLFDPDTDSPGVLLPESPCIDGGDSLRLYDDPEDQLHPGLARWPAQGTVRNDMGWTGGPLAASWDSSWTALPNWRPQVLPRDFSLGLPLPNPFNPSTQISFTLARPLRVRLTVHNLLGQEVAVLVNRVMPAGAHQAVFGSHRLASGVYLVTLEAAGGAETRTVTLLR